MKLYNEIMKMNSYLKKFNKGLLLDKNGLIKGITNNLMCTSRKQKKINRR